MDAFLIVYEVLVQKAIQGLPGSPNRDKIFQILSVLETQPSAASTFFEIIANHVIHDSVASKYHCLLIIDFAFKFGSRELLMRLQSSKLIKVLQNNAVIQNHFLYNYLYSSVPSWMKKCEENGIVEKKFRLFVSNIRKSHYVPELTIEIRRKFEEDMQMADEMVIDFAKKLIQCHQDSLDISLVQEMHPFIEEIESRLTELMLTIVDEGFKKNLLLSSSLCKACILNYISYCENGIVDVPALQSSISEKEQYLESMLKKLTEEKSRKRIPEKVTDDMNDNEFFYNLNQIKKNEGKFRINV